MSFTTINLVKLAIEAAKEAQANLRMNFELGKDSEKYMTEKYNKEVKKIFLNKLETYTDIAARQLYDRYKFQCTAVAKQFPLLMSGLWQDSENLRPIDRVEEVLKHRNIKYRFYRLSRMFNSTYRKTSRRNRKISKIGNRNNFSDERRV